jgi:hypothetical protein
MILDSFREKKECTGNVLVYIPPIKANFYFPGQRGI